jgi:hypothetical protein
MNTAAAAAAHAGAPVVHASSQLGMHSIIFYVIFGSDMQGTLEFVHASAVRLHSITQCKFLAGMMSHVMQNSASIAPDIVKALFFLFLNVDMVLKNYVCTPSSVDAFAEAMNIRVPKVNGGNARKRQVEMLGRMHAWSMIGTRGMDHAKARRFFTALHDSVVRRWMQDERLNAADLVRMVKDEFLVS